MNVAITGSTSVIGIRLIQELTKSGYQVTPLGGSLSCLWKLGERFPKGVSADALIHLAHDRSMTLEENIRAAKELCESFPGIKIFLSSFSAHSNTKSNYGQSKFAIEQIFADSGGVSLRAGLVYGYEVSGMYARLEALIKSFPVTPVPYFGASLLFTSHIDDLINEIILSLNTDLGAPVFAAHNKPISLLELSRQIANKEGLKRVLVPLPRQPIELLLKTALLLIPKLSLIDSLTSLSSQATNKDLSQLKIPTTVFREFDLNF